jgi:hypothetical protein
MAVLETDPVTSLDRLTNEVPRLISLTLAKRYDVHILLLLGERKLTKRLHRV